MKVVFIASEVAPYAKTGGLGDVCAALPKAIAELGHEVAVFLPYYQCARDLGVPCEQAGPPIRVPILDRVSGGVFFKTQMLGSLVPVYLLENHHYYSRPGIYGEGGEYPDNVERYAFFCRAVLEFCGEMGFTPDIIHCHDWQTALIPPYLKTLYRRWGNFSHTRSVITLHNLAYQGHFWKEDLKLTGLSWDLFHRDCLECYDGLNLLKGGISMADFLTTVSPNYAREIQTAGGGFGMEGMLANRSNSLVGIVNGVDYTIWDPATDRLLPATYHADDLSGKRTCKQYIQKTYGMRVTDDLPLVAIVSRLTSQKGFNLVQQAIEYFLAHNLCQLVLLGGGDQALADFFQYLAMKYPDLAHAEIRHDEELAHRNIAAADLFLMPSAFEPCGLTQLYSLKYGTVPLVRATGGLSDTVTPVSYENLIANRATGFMFEQFSGRAFGECLDIALKFWHNRQAWARLQAVGMRQDWSWGRSAREYLGVYHHLLGGF